MNININSIPNPVFLDILSYLKLKDLQCASWVCKKWRQLIEDENLWKIIFYRDLNWIPDRIEQKDHRWKQIYLNHKAKKKWAKHIQAANLGSSVHLRCSTDSYTTHSVIFSNGAIGDEAKNRQDKQLDKETHNYLDPYSLHSSFLKQNGNLLIQENRGQIEVWDWKEGHCITFELGGCIQSLVCNDKWLAAYTVKKQADQSTLKIWNMQAGEQAFWVNKEYFSCLNLQNNYLLAGSFQGSPLYPKCQADLSLWNLETKTCEASVSCNQQIGWAFFKGTDIVAILRYDREIKIWKQSEFATNSCSTLKLSGIIAFAQLYYSYLICGFEATGVIEIWNLDKDYQIATLTPHLDGIISISSICIISNKLIVGYSKDNLIIWDLKNPKEPLNRLKTPNGQPIFKIWATQNYITALTSLNQLYRWNFEEQSLKEAEKTESFWQNFQFIRVSSVKNLFS